MTDMNGAITLAIAALDTERSHAADNLQRCKLQIECSPDIETTMRYNEYAAGYDAELRKIEDAIATLRAAREQPADGDDATRGGA
jgi:hypothetical protein